jgi:excinuclease ABC subunit B
MTPRGDQPAAIDALVRSLGVNGDRAACLLGATGTGKTFTMANVIQRLARPTLIISHNKTLAAQLYEEMRELFPHNAVCYFVSYYDYYQPEAYIPQRDIYIEKDASRNDDLDRLRLAATSSLLSRDDVIVVASVSCIFGLGSPEVYGDKVLPFVKGSTINRRELFLSLTDMQYVRADAEFLRGRFRVRGDSVEVWPAYEKFGVRVEMFDDEIESIHLIDPVSGETIVEEDRFFLYPAVHYVMPEDEMERALSAIRAELEARVMQLRSEGKLLEAQRLLARTRYDLEMMDEIGYCSGVENYSRHLDGRAPGETPFTLLDYFDWSEGWTRATRTGTGGKRDWLCMIDESHVSIPQIRAMFNGDRARKDVLVEHGFRLPSAMDNRPLRFEEFTSIVRQTLYVSATPAPYELEQTGGVVVEQIIRPTGLIDPTIEVLPARTQAQDLLEKCRVVVDNGERVLVTALTKKLCEQLAEHMDERGLRVRYLHSDILTLDRLEILRALREGEFDVLVGVNLLREGLDLPEVALVCILDADKEGFLRSPTSLIQQMGRAARNINAHVILYADKVTNAMRRAMDETERRRVRQLAYNEANGITPTQIVKAIRQGIETELKGRRTAREAVERSEPEFERDELLRLLEEEMLGAAEALDFESAAMLRDQIRAVEESADLAAGGGKLKRSEAEKAASKGPAGKKTAPGAAGSRPRSRKKAGNRRRD